MKANAIQTALLPAPAKARRRTSGFTLLELLVVMAITALLLTLIFGPIVTSFNLTSRARTQIESQTTARNTLSLINRLLSSAVFVYDNSQTPLNIYVQKQADYGVNTTQTAIPTLFTMIEYVSPGRQLDQRPGTTPIDPTTGEPIYDLPNQTNGQKGFAVPLAPGRSLGRIWLGLNNNGPAAQTADSAPKKAYTNALEDVALSRSLDNRYQLFHAEVVAYIPKDPNSPNSPYVVDTRLFRTNPNGSIILHDPNFFYDGTLAVNPQKPNAPPGSAATAMPGWRDLNGDGKVEIGENWRAVANPLMPTDKSDAIALDRDPDTNEINYDSQTNLPTVRPLITFSPTFLQNDPGVPTSLENAANEAPSPSPVNYTSQYTHWASPYRVMVYRNSATSVDDPNANADPLSLDPLNYYQYVVKNDGTAKIVHVSVPVGNPPPSDTALLDDGTYPDVSQLTHKFYDNTRPEMAFTVDPQRGIINFGFSSAETATGYTFDAEPGAQRYSPDAINQGLADPNVQKRYLDLHAIPRNVWGTLPLNPIAGAGAPARDNTHDSLSVLGLYDTNRSLTTFAPVKIVPGSERVYGPDQIPGPHQGYRIQYTRVSATAGIIGPNQYKINYDDLPNARYGGANDPRIRMGYIEFNSTPDSVNQLNPDINGDPTKNPSVNSMPLYKYDSAGNRTFSDPVEVYYSFQMNRVADVVKADYLTRSVMNIVLEARLYDPSSSRPQVTDVSSKIRVRNLQR